MKLYAASLLQTAANLLVAPLFFGVPSGSWSDQWPT